MKLIKQHLLHYYDAVKNSDKVYNIYVFEASPTNFVVKSAWGRRNTSLRQNPDEHFTNRADAEYSAQLNADKRKKKGYDDVTTPITQTIKFTEDYIKQLKISAAFLVAEGILERNHYQNIKGLLESGDEKNLTMAEEIILAQESNLNAA